MEELDSVLKEQNFRYEIVIVNDNSTDGTLKLARSLSKKYSKLRIVDRKPPGGFGRAIKDGFRAAKGEVVVPVMGDLSDYNWNFCDGFRDLRTLLRKKATIQNPGDCRHCRHHRASGSCPQFLLAGYLSRTGDLTQDKIGEE